MITKNIFGHVLRHKIYHIIRNKKETLILAKCNYNLFLCNICLDINYMQFNKICKKCFKMISKKEQEELVHYFCVKKLKG